MARAGGWVRDVPHGKVPAAGTVHFAVDVDDVPAALGSRPDRLSEVRPQEWAQRRIVQQIINPVPLPTLDDLAPQMVGQLLNLAQFFDTPLPDPEQVIEVPKILSDDVPMRTPVREPQLVEQLVEVPTELVSSSRPLTFQLLVVEGDTQIFKVFSVDRVQQRRSFLRNAFLSGL